MSKEPDIRIITDGKITYTDSNKKVEIPYHLIQSPEITLKGRVGKHTPFGFVLKPDVKSDTTNPPDPNLQKKQLSADGIKETIATLFPNATDEVKETLLTAIEKDTKGFKQPKSITQKDLEDLITKTYMEIKPK